MEDREVGGVRCRVVLELLPDYLDGTLDAELRATAEAHLRGCDWCARFGGRYAEAVGVIRGTLRPAAPEAVGERIRARLWG